MSSNNESECEESDQKMSQDEKKSLEMINNVDKESNNVNNSNNINNNNKIVLDEFVKQIPKWGASFLDKYKSNMVEIKDTCTIDYFLLSFWTMTKLSDFFQKHQKELEVEKILNNIIDLANNALMNEAKILCIYDLCGLRPSHKNGILIHLS